MTEATGSDPNLQHGPVVGMIWAQAHHRVIGHSGSMPWHVPEDMIYFKEVTRGCPVIMGRRTWASLPGRFRPLPGRTNIVITRDPERAAVLEQKGALTASSVEAAVELAQSHVTGTQTVWIMGGGAIYAETVEKGLAQLASVTQLDLKADGDTFAPELPPAQWELVTTMPQSGWETSETGTRYRFETYRRRSATLE